MAAAFKAVTFDVDGTLYDFRELGSASEASDAPERRRFFEAYMDAREAVRARGEVGDVHALQCRGIAQRLECSTQRADALCRRFIDDTWKRFDRVAPVRGVRELLQALQAAGVRLGVISDYPAEAKLRGLGLDGFDWRARVAAEELGALKPHRLAYETAMRRLEIDDPADVLHVGDRRDADVGGAKQAGMAAALFTGGNRIAWSGIGFEPDLEFDDYRQLMSWLDLA